MAHNGNRTSRKVGSKDAAVEVATKIQARLHLVGFELEEEKKPEPTFKEYADLWIKVNAPATCKESTVESYDAL